MGKSWEKKGQPRMMNYITNDPLIQFFHVNGKKGRITWAEDSTHTPEDVCQMIRTLNKGVDVAIVSFYSVIKMDEQEKEK